MGKRIAPESHTASAHNIRKRKRVYNDYQDVKTDQKWEETNKSPEETKTLVKHHALNISIDDNNSPKPVYHLRPSIVNGIILEDLTEKQWRIGKPIGKGNFGEIFLASDNIFAPVTNENAKYVVKIEPHSNGPLFVEIHCLLNTAKNNDEIPLPPGMPEYIASGSHYFDDARYRFLVLKRFDRDLHSLIKNRRVSQKSVLTLALQIIDVLEHLHDKGYCHNDIKAQNLMISNCTFRKSQLQRAEINKSKLYGRDDKGSSQEKRNRESENTDSDSGNSSNEEDGEDDDDDEEAESNEEDVGEDDEEEGEEMDEDEQDIYKTPINKRHRAKTVVQYSGSNPVRSCRRDKRNSIYDEMVKSHYLRPAKRISYSEFFNEDSSKDDLVSEYHGSHYSNGKFRTSVRQAASATKQRIQKQMSGFFDTTIAEDETITEERVFLIDFGLASKFMDDGVHRPFVMDQRRAHDGTLEFTSRDAHMGAHSRRSDLECLGYNLLFWSQGYLPWKDAAAQYQNERVHWIKEYLMKDVKEMLKHIYGKQVPKYLGEFLQYVGQLAYHERPDYEKCRRIFKREYVALGFALKKMQLSTDELIRTSVKVKEEIENNNVLEMKNIKSIMKNLSVIMPFHESTLSNRVSPKNLRSKSAKKKSLRKKFSWTEILSQDPDQIARERAEKEFDREPTIETPLIRYKGKPTYAILEIQNRLKLKDRIDAFPIDEASSDEEAVAVNAKASSMRKRNILPVISEVVRQTQINIDSNCNNTKNGAGAPTKSSRAKAGLRTFITTSTIGNSSTKRGMDHAQHLANTTANIAEKRQRRTRRCLIKTGSTGDFTTSDESSCSSINSHGIQINNHQTINIKKVKPSTNVSGMGRRRKLNRSDRSSSTDRSSNNSLNITSEEDDTSNCSDNALLFSPKRTRNATEKLKMKSLDTKNSSPNNLLRNESVVGAKRRKRSIPKKRKSSTKDDCFEDAILGERHLRAFKKRACRG